MRTLVLTAGRLEFNPSLRRPADPTIPFPSTVVPHTLANMGLSPGDIISLSIDDLAFGGEGVGRLDDFVIFVPFVAPGDCVEAQITELKKRFGRAKLLRVVQPSPDRVQAQCPYFTQCGGCQYQHLAYPAQLNLKRKQVADLFQRIGGLDPAIVSPVIPCPKPYGYRNRIMVRSQWDKFKQGLNLGFIRADNRLVVDIEHCPIAEPGINEMLRELRAHPPPKGGLKVVLRLPPPGWDVPPDSFFQNNFSLLPQLVELVRQRLADSGARHLVDAYCGVGFFSLELASQLESFVGVEYDHLAVKAARRNAENRGCANGQFIAGKTEELLPSLVARFQPHKTAVLLDPPRKGCDPDLLELLRRHPPAQLLYISCHPATMARDLNILTRDGVFTVAQVVPVDMFPQTAHVECAADLRAKSFQPAA